MKGFEVFLEEVDGNLSQDNLSFQPLCFLTSCLQVSEMNDARLTRNQNEL